MNKTKPWYKSKTIISGIIATLTTLAVIFDVSVSESLIDEAIRNLFAFVSALMTIYGRIVAETKVE